MVTTQDIAWMAGLLEGEACFMTGNRSFGDKTYKRIYIQLVMTDEDVVQRVADFFGTNCRPMSWIKGATKPTWRTAAHGDRAAGWMMTIYKFMSARRQAKIRDCLAVWKQSPGKTKLQRATAKAEVA